MAGHSQKSQGVLNLPDISCYPSPISFMAGHLSPAFGHRVRISFISSFPCRYTVPAWPYPACQGICPDLHWSPDMPAAQAVEEGSSGPCFHARPGQKRAVVACFNPPPASGGGRAAAFSKPHPCAGRRGQKSPVPVHPGEGGERAVAARSIPSENGRRGQWRHVPAHPVPMGEGSSGRSDPHPRTGKRGQWRHVPAHPVPMGEGSSAAPIPIRKRAGEGSVAGFIPLLYRAGEESSGA